MSWLTKLKKKYENDRFFDEVFNGRIYREAYDIGQVDTVLDVGACAGEFSFYIYDHAKHIYALEPEAWEYTELVNNINDHNLTKIKSFPLALSDTNKNVYLKTCSRGAHFIFKDKSTEGELPEVRCRTLNTFLEEQGIESVDILKIDIENGEDKVFSSPDIDEAMKKVKFICGEHGNLDLIEKHGFIIEQTGHGWVARRPE